MFLDPPPPVSLSFSGHAPKYVVRGTKLYTALKVQPHQSWVQRDNHLPAPAGNTISDTSQDAIGLLGHLGRRHILMQVTMKSTLGIQNKQTKTPTFILLNYFCFFQNICHDLNTNWIKVMDNKKQSSLWALLKELGTFSIQF